MPTRPRPRPLAAPVARRAPRRAVPKDAERSRESLLAAAEREFARSGLGGARVDRIAAQAGLNVRMLYYYYGSKDALFIAVLERAYATIRTAEEALELDQIEPVEAARRFVRFTWRFQLDHPEFITLLNSENLHKARHLKKSARVADMHSPLLATLGRLLGRGARAGLFRKNIDPLQLYISIAGLGYFYLSNRFTLGAIFDRDLMLKSSLDARLAHMTEVVLGYLRPAPHGAGQ